MYLNTKKTFSEQDKVSCFCFACIILVTYIVYEGTYMYVQVWIWRCDLLSGIHTMNRKASLLCTGTCPKWLKIEKKWNKFWVYLHVDGFIFVGTNFCGLNKIDNFVGFKIRGFSIFIHNLYRKLPFHGYCNSWIRPSMKTTKIGTPRNLSHLQYIPDRGPPFVIVILRPIGSDSMSKG